MLSGEDEEVRNVALRDLDDTDKVKEAYPVGKLVRAVMNKNGRLSLKQSVINVVDSKAAKKDQAALVESFQSLSTKALATQDLHIG
jgi:hypothetical protein